MKNNNDLLLSLISIILFSIIFITILIFYNDIIVLNNSMKSFTREYYDWYMDSYWNNNYANIEVTTYIIKMIFGLILLLEFSYIVSIEKYSNKIDKKNLVISIIVGILINYFISVSIQNNVEHYRLFMTIIPIQILALVLLNMVLKLKASLKLDL